MPTNTKTFEEMAVERAEELKKLNGDIYIMYSGGINSTTALVALLISWSKEELERVHILTSISNIKEFPQMWNLIVEKFKGRINTSYVNIEKICEKGYVITGEHGDQIFGGNNLKKITKYFDTESIHQNWEDKIPILYSYLFSESIAKKFIEVYRETTIASPFPIKSCFDLEWWLNFTNEWQSTKYKILSVKSWNNPQVNYSKIYRFFDTPEWQRWSIDNHDKKIENNLTSYKLPAKKFIVSHTNYNAYMAKRQIKSGGFFWPNKEFYDAIDDNLNYIDSSKAMEFINGK
jgi:hypothetical protein